MSYSTQPTGFNLSKPDVILIQCDGNGTMVLGDTTKKVNTLIAETAGSIIWKWDENHPAMSFKEYVQKVLFPGNKYDEKIKKLQEEKIGQFLKDLKEDHPCYPEANKTYEALAKDYLDSQTQQVKFTPFPSLINLLNKVSNLCLYTFTLRTFGFDGKVIAKEMNALHTIKTFDKSDFRVETEADFIDSGLKIKGEQSLRKGVELFKSLQENSLVGQDQVQTWFANGRKASHGKPIYCVENAQFEGKTILTIFLDDNLQHYSNRKNNIIQPTDPQAVDIAIPVDIYGRSTSWDSRGIIGIRVNTVKAALNPDYFVNKVNKHLVKRGFTPLA
ncbi:MAG: hypothetical protein K0S74_817 [Chlamydiales bacterium]|jgi:hypothetical protein|nr:hypothetical protein [Chlamydiales bacterium]